MRPSILLLLLSLSSFVRCTVKLCEQGQVWARGRELLAALRGQVVLVAFPSASDRATLQKLSSLAESHPHVRFVALLDPLMNSAEKAEMIGRDWRWLLVDRDDVGSQQRLGVNPGHVALFDRCGRLSRSLALTATNDLTQALRAAQHHAACGWCEYGTGKNGEGGGTTTVEKKLDAFFQSVIASPQTPQGGQQRVHSQSQQRPHQHQQQNQNRQQPYNPQNAQRSNMQHMQHSQQIGQQQGTYDRQLQMQQHQQQRPHQQHLQQPQQRGYPSASTVADTYRTPQSSSVHVGHPTGRTTHYSQIRPNEYAQRGSHAPATTGEARSAPSSTPSQSPSDDYSDYEDIVKNDVSNTESVDLRTPAFNNDEQWATASPFHQRRPHKDLFSRPPSSTYQSTYAAEFQAPATAVSANNNGGTEDYADYEDYGAMKTFPGSPQQLQQFKQAETLRTTQSRARSVDQPRHAQHLQQRDYDQQQDEDEVPCKAVTDDICYHQKKSGRKLSKCCKKGVYIADFCLPGKCSNTTTQACCMQKYLQAKYQCCEDESMEGTTATDAFSRCCHTHFTAEDDCCPAEAAADYWQSVHDICLPNVQADLSGIKLEIRLSDGIRVLDMAETDRWQHECTYGTRRAQYVYVP